MNLFKSLFSRKKNNLEESFSERFSAIKSVFINAHRDAVNLQSEMNKDIEGKESLIDSINADIRVIQDTKNIVGKFIDNLEGLI